MTMKSGLDFFFFYFEILLAHSEIPANLPGQFSPPGQIFLQFYDKNQHGLLNKNFVLYEFWILRTGVCKVSVDAIKNVIHRACFGVKNHEGA